MVPNKQKMVVYPDASTFLENTRNFFERHEVENNLPFGLALRAQKTETEARPKTFFSTLENSRGPLLSGTITPDHNLLLARLRPRSTPQLDIMADYFIEHQIPLPGVIGVTPLVDEFAMLWEQRTGVKTVVNMRQRIYQLREVRLPRHLTPR
ncbi:MAG: hypothetical protein HGA86_08510, partial [Anaerolineaceae bacterium]|nr:hypothetical protein [Anaerolineaceae bacterium]